MIMLAYGLKWVIAFVQVDSTLNETVSGLIVSTRLNTLQGFEAQAFIFVGAVHEVPVASGFTI